jgi:hypothetical protein
MPKRLLAGLLLLCALIAFAACNDDDDDGDGVAEPTATAPAPEEPTATPSGGDETPADGVGIPEVDDILDAVLSNNAAQIRPRVRFVAEPCESRPSNGAVPPPCAEGEAEGTEIEGIEIGTCEGEFRRRADFDAWVEQVFEVESLFGVYRGPASQGADADYVAVFELAALGGQERALAVSIDGGVIVYMKFSCGETAQELVDLLELGEQVG